MTPEQITQCPPVAVTLRDGRTASIRPLAPADEEALAAFYMEIPREDLRYYYPHPMDREHAARNAGKAHSPLSVALVLALPEGRIGGYASYDWASPDADKSTFGICVARDCQGMGAGRVLMTHLLAIARRLGPPVMTLTVQLANQRAVTLYRSMGFLPVREQMVSHDPSLGFDDEPEYYMEQRVR